MSDTPATDRQPQTGPGFDPPQAPVAPAAPAGYGAQPAPQQPPAGQLPPPPGPQSTSGAPPAAYAPQGPAGAQPPEQAFEQEHQWTPDGLVSTTVPVLPPERVGRGALLALLAIPVGVVLSAVIWKLGFIASISGVIVAAGAALLYVRGSGGRLKKGIPVILAIIVVGIVASFFAAVAVDLWDVFPQVDPQVAQTYPSRGSFVTENLFYGPVLGEYTSTIVLFVLFGVLGAFGTILRVVRANAALQR